MPRGTQNPKHKTKVSDGGFRHNIMVQSVSKHVSEAFLTNHLLIEGDPRYQAKKSAIEKRDVAVSTAICADRESISKIVQMVKGWNKERVEAPGTGKIKVTTQPFKVLERDAGGQLSEKEVHISYSMIKDDKSGRWILHHLQGSVDPDATNYTKGEFLRETYDSSDYDVSPSPQMDDSYDSD